MGTGVQLFVLPFPSLSTPKPNLLFLKRRHVTAYSQTDCPVPLDQQPVNEYKSLSESFPFSWPTGHHFETNMFVSAAAFAMLLGFPVAWVGSQTGVETDPTRAVLGAVSSGLIFAMVAAVRMYLGWAYVGNRLLSATVEYEETGWYDGQIWVKNAEVLARDRLLGSFSVKPVLSRLKNTLVVLAASLFICASMLINLEGNQKNLYNISNEPGGRAIPGVYNDESARSFEPDAFCGEPDLQ